MKPVGIERPVDALGRVVIPKGLRRTLGIEDGDTVEIVATDRGILLRLTKTQCCHCGNDAKDGIRHREVPVCRQCHEELKRL